MYIKYLEEWDPIAQSAVNLDSKTYKKEKWKESQK